MHFFQIITQPPPANTVECLETFSFIAESGLAVEVIYNCNPNNRDWLGLNHIAHFVPKGGGGPTAIEIVTAEIPDNFELGVYPHDDEALYIDNIRVAQGGRVKMYDLLMRDGRVITQGIYFDTGKADLKPESTPTLLQLERMLKDHPDLRIRIEGHTDSTGFDAINQPLSENRAGAVRHYLIDHGIAADRLEAVGLGASRPVVSNDTAEARAQNRCTEVWRLDEGQ